MPRKATLISNSLICVVLVTVSFFVFTLNVDRTFLGITAPLYSGSRDTKTVAFMFIVNDNAHAANLPFITGSLNTAKAGATFFVSGMFAGNNMEMVKNLGDGFELGNHGFSGARLNITDKSKITTEIVFCRDIIKAVSGKTPALFTPPDLLYNRTTLGVAGELGYKTVLPTARRVTINWATADTNLVLSYATHDTKGGDIIMFRPTTATMQSIARVIAHFLERGFKIVSVGSLLHNSY